MGVTEWYTAYVTLNNLLSTISETDYPDLYSELNSALTHVKALLRSAIG